MFKVLSINIKYNTIKPLQENIGKTFSDINRSSIFSDQSSKTKEIKVKINKSDLIKLKSLGTEKETINEMKRKIYGLGESIFK